MESALDMNCSRGVGRSWERMLSHGEVAEPRHLLLRLTPETSGARHRQFPSTGPYQLLKNH